ncbi:HAD-IIB family hydrolase [Spiroplasma endosymbiont of Megaselia nigra]|uniref:HAD-IIB family hydrolase n=1 Tax=Spiroplasma endosymbiont of Megaselia nigra TaxID=2478537 RepID=UPI000F884514|nr:HAD family hydrolase [Spiroplasma endosymbiont of Megaselia nigra]RUO86805.1 HAD family phosphatase [Spiroplasma endosymbiont of Megaselia nigra]
MLKINGNQIKLIVTDVDGTLITDKQELPTLVQNKLLALQAKGIAVSIASGRMPPGFDNYTRELKIKDYCQYVIGANGALVYDTKNNKSIYSNLMPVSDLVIVIDILIKYKCDFTISYQDDDNLYCAGEKLLKIKSKPGAFLDGMKQVKPFCFDDIRIANKIVAKHSSKIMFQEMYTALKQVLNINVEPLSEYGCDIVHGNSNKGQAILHLIDILNQRQGREIKLENVLYFGDNYNDCSVFEILPYAIAMEHSPTPILNLAYDVASSNNTGGIYHYLNNLEKNN